MTSSTPLPGALPVRASGLVAIFAAQGVLGTGDVNVALALAAMVSERRDDVKLAAALTVRALRNGSVCLDLTTVHQEVFDRDEENVDVSDLPWPDPEQWLAAVGESPLVSVIGDAAAAPSEQPRPLVLHERMLYLHRYHRDETTVLESLTARRRQPAPSIDPDRLAAALDRFTDRSALADDELDRQRMAVAAAALHQVSVIAGGPGTGKTTTVARVIATLQEVHDRPLTIRLAAPTGKASARLVEAVTQNLGELRPAEDTAPQPQFSESTLHSLLGLRPGTSRARHHAGHPLPFDVIVVDEMSMVALPLMALLLQATRPGTRLVLVGDPDQLTSVDAGSVMADITRAPANDAPMPPDDPRLQVLTDCRADDRHQPGDRTELVPMARGIVELTRVWRFGDDIGALARAIARGDVDEALEVLVAGGDHLDWIQADLTTAAAGGGDSDPWAAVRANVLDAGRIVHAAALAGDDRTALAGVEQHRVLCAHRRGPYGASHWAEQVEQWLRADIPGYGEGGEWYLGRPLLASRNLREIGLSNGDTGVVVDHGGRPTAVFSRAGLPRSVPLIQLDSAQTVHAMTVHKAQGSQFDTITVVLPPPDSPLLTRELIYTALTRASRQVRIIASEESLRAGIERPAQRASGLRRRLPVV